MFGFKVICWALLFIFKLLTAFKKRQGQGKGRFYIFERFYIEDFILSKILYQGKGRFYIFRFYIIQNRKNLILPEQASHVGICIVYNAQRGNRIVLLY